MGARLLPYARAFGATIIAVFAAIPAASSLVACTRVKAWVARSHDAGASSGAASAGVSDPTTRARADGSWAETPLLPVPPLGAEKIAPAPVGGIALGPRTTCAVLDDARVECWGGDLTQYRNVDHLPRTVVDGLDAVVEIAASESHACARRRDGAVVCWGSSRYGKLGLGTSDEDAAGVVNRAPSRVLGIDKAISIAVGRYHSCAVRAGGVVSCWGSNIYGQLGDGAKEDRGTPAPVPGLPRGIVRLAGGDDGTCALSSAGEVFCWGNSGRGDEKGRATRVDGIEHAVAISVGTLYACALRQDGVVVCWRWLTCDGGLRDWAAPIDGVGRSVAIAAGSGFACALDATGKVSCWGENEHGALGDGTRDARCTARPVLGLVDAVEIAAAPAGGAACARRRGGSVVCWGSDAEGQLGRATVKGCEFRGQIFDAPTPKPVPCALSPVLVE